MPAGFSVPKPPQPLPPRVSGGGVVGAPPGLDDSINTATELEAISSIGGEETVNSVDGGKEVTRKQCSESPHPLGGGSPRGVDIGNVKLCKLIEEVGA